MTDEELDTAIRDLERTLEVLRGVKARRGPPIWQVNRELTECPDCKKYPGGKCYGHGHF